ncbi:MAG TPA: BtrH N-terminal domain-containing protein [Flavobacteriaceae bacterium]|nr:BtrH N-terminal domain-containing protein [Flavobacteriaceae bacterium]
MTTNFVHYQSAHCENGVTSSLLRNGGLDISEPMIFGIGSGLYFVFLPFLKVNHAPAVSFRPLSGLIFKRAVKRLGIKMKRRKFRSKQQAAGLLDINLKNNIPTGLQVGVYHLSYFPDEYRFHFNAHNLIVFGKTDTHYLISDPVMQYTTELTFEELEKVRFTKGVFAPKGQMYYPIHIPEKIDLKKAIIKGIKNTCRDMLAPPPIVGVNGMKYLSKKIRKWPHKIGEKKTNHYLAQIVRMQEEIGTGGGGFRFVYAAFLQEAAGVLKRDELNSFSAQMTEIGDQWRDFAVNASRVYKQRSQQKDVYNALADQLYLLSELEKSFFKNLKKFIRTVA